MSGNGTEYSNSVMRAGDKPCLEDMVKDLEWEIAEAQKEEGASSTSIETIERCSALINAVDHVTDLLDLADAVAVKVFGNEPVTPADVLKIADMIDSEVWECTLRERKKEDK